MEKGRENGLGDRDESRQFSGCRAGSINGALASKHCSTTLVFTSPDKVWKKEHPNSLTKSSVQFQYDCDEVLQR